MAEEPDRLRQEIESTRASLTRDVDLLADKTSPSKVAQRRWTAVKEKVMGSSEHAKHAASDKVSYAGDVAGQKAHRAADAVRAAPQAVASQAQGNPLAAGIIAFGVGLLASTLIPVTDAERRAGQQLKDHSGDLTEKVKDVAGELKDDLAGTAQEAVGQVKQTAQDAAQRTRETARTDAQDVRDQAKQAAS